MDNFNIDNTEMLSEDMLLQIMSFLDIVTRMTKTKCVSHDWKRLSEISTNHTLSPSQINCLQFNVSWFLDILTLIIKEKRASQYWKRSYEIEIQNQRRKCEIEIQNQWRKYEIGKIVIQRQKCRGFPSVIPRNQLASTHTYVTSFESNFVERFVETSDILLYIELIEKCSYLFHLLKIDHSIIKSDSFFWLLKNDKVLSEYYNTDSITLFKERYGLYGLQPPRNPIIFLEGRYGRYILDEDKETKARSLFIELMEELINLFRLEEFGKRKQNSTMNKKNRHTNVTKNRRSKSGRIVKTKQKNYIHHNTSRKR